MIRFIVVSLLAVSLGSGLATAAPSSLPDLFTPAPHLSPAPALPEIGRVRSSSCRSLANWSAAASQSATKNDVTLNGLLQTLPKIDLDDVPKPRQDRVLQNLRNSASEVRLRAREGLSVTATIRAYANSLSDLVQRGDLIAYVQALDDALHNQATAAQDMQRALVIAEGRRAVIEGMQLVRPDPSTTDLTLDDPGSYHSTFVAIAGRIEERQADVRQAERAAAEQAKKYRC